MNPPRGDGVWALCSPLACFIIKLYKVIKCWNKMHFYPWKWIERITSLLEEKRNEERGWKKDILVSWVTQNLFFKKYFLLLFLKPAKNQWEKMLESHELVKLKYIILRYSKCLKIVKFYLKNALWETPLDLVRDETF